MTFRFGGLFSSIDNVKNLNALDYLVDAVKSEMFGMELYPDVSTKAAIYMFNIISNHVFNDGNKRTGLETALLFLERNNFVLNFSVTDDELIALALAVAEGKFNLESLTAWFVSRVIRKY